MNIRRCSFFLLLILIFWNENSMALELFSTQFKQGEPLPQMYTCDGRNISPPLAWKDVPTGTKSLVLILEDPDAPAGTWDHWILYNIPPTVTSLSEDFANLPNGTLGGKNSWNNTTYGGPCPPDREHRYFFKLYAVDTMLPNQLGLDKQAIGKALKDHVLASTELMTRYQRSK